MIKWLAFVNMATILKFNKMTEIYCQNN